MYPGVTQETYIYGEIVLPRWRASIPVAMLKSDRKEQYVPVRVMCAIIGVQRKRQLAILRRDYRAALKTLPLETAGGVQEATWIHRQECAVWVGTINPLRTKLENRANLEAFQADFKAEAQKLLFEGPRKPLAKRGMFAHSERMEYVFSCLACGAGHRIIAQNGEVTLERYEF